MRLTKSSEYAIRTVFALKSDDPTRFVPLRELAEELEIPYHQLAKVAQKLVGADLLFSYTGPTGGVRLAKAPNEIALIDIILATEGDGFTDRCLLGQAECGGTNPCPLHFYWAPIRDALVELFHSKTLADLVDPNDVIPTVLDPTVTLEKETSK